MDPLYCTACGHELRAGDLFCTACGVPVDSAVPAAVAGSSAPVVPAPRVDRPARPRGRRTAWWVVAALAAVAVVIGAYALGTATARHSTASAGAPIVATDGNDTGAGATGDPGSSSTSPSPSLSPAALAQARALHELLTHSAADKQAIAVAAAQLQGCRHVPRAIRTFQDAAASRQSLVMKAAGLRVGLLPGGGEAVANLSEALRAAADADDAYVAWGQARHRVGHRCRGGKALRAQAVHLSAASHAPKQAAADAWNVIAAQVGLPAITWTSL